MSPITDAVCLFPQVGFTLGNVVGMYLAQNYEVSTFVAIDIAYVSMLLRRSVNRTRVQKVKTLLSQISPNQPWFMMTTQDGLAYCAVHLFWKETVETMY